MAGFSITEPQNTAESGELEAFLDAEWDAWHQREGHDPDEDWSSKEVVFVARDDAGSIVGAALGRYSVGIGHLSELMVAEDRRGKGLGAELVSRFEDRCWAVGCHKLTVHTQHGGGAHRFYQRLGWEDEAVFRRDRGGRDFVRLCKFRDSRDETRRV